MTISQVADHRITSVQKVLQECFWGDYRISEKDILEKLESGDPGFARFLFSKVIENSRYSITRAELLYGLKRLPAKHRLHLVVR